MDKHGVREAAEAFVDFLGAPRRSAPSPSTGSRPVDPAVAAGSRVQVPAGRRTCGRSTTRRLGEGDRRDLRAAGRLTRVHEEMRSADELARPKRRAPPAAPPRGRGARWGLRSSSIAYLGSDDRAAARRGLRARLRGRACGVLGGDRRARSPWTRSSSRWSAAAIMTAVNAVMGTLTAYVLVRYDFPGEAC